MISKILVATDGSKTSGKAIKYAVELAKQTGASALLLTVIDKSFIVPQSIPVTRTGNKIIEPLEDYLRQAAYAHLGEAERLCKKNDIPAKTVVRSGHPVEEIVKEAKKSKVDVIVMGSHGNSALKAALLGSVTFGVIHKDTNIPVLVVRR